eukprot:scaffold5477_cov124-Isochrysis_galbana.AAC.9
MTLLTRPTYRCGTATAHDSVRAQAVSQLPTRWLPAAGRFGCTCSRPRGRFRTCHTAGAGW